MPGSAMKIVTRGGRGRAARVGSPVRDAESSTAAPIDAGVAARRSRRHRRRRSEHQRAQRRRPARCEPSRDRCAKPASRESKAASSDTTTCSTTTASATAGRSTTCRTGTRRAVSALEYNEGSVDLVIRAGAAAGDPVVIQVRPEGSGLQVDNRLVTVAEIGNRRADAAAAAWLVARRRARADSREGRAVRAHGVGRQSDGIFCVGVSRTR